MFAVQTPTPTPTSSVAARGKVRHQSSSSSQRCQRCQAVKINAVSEETMESVKEKALVASTSLATLAVTSPAFAYNLFSAENAGAIKVWILGLFVGPLGLITIFLPFVCGTINPIQMAINLGLVEGEVSNLRKFKRNGEPMEHGTKFGHKWYDTSAFKNGKDIDFAFTSKTKEAQEKSA